MKQLTLTTQEYNILRSNPLAKGKWDLVSIKKGFVTITIVAKIAEMLGF